MDDLLVQIPAAIESISSRADHSWKIVTGTAHELTPDQVATLAALARGGSGFFLFKQSEIIQADVPEMDVAAPEEKSPSRRLRAVMWHYWDTRTSKKPPFETFETWYKHMMEKDIQRWKERLD
jgi:hypothetical protein